MLRSIKILGLLFLFLNVANAQDIKPPNCIINGGTITCGSSSVSPGTGPGGSTNTLQYNAGSGLFGGISGWTTNGSTTIVGGTGTTLTISGATLGLNALAVGGMAASIGASGSSPGFYSYLSTDAVARVRIGMDATNTASLAFGAGGASARDTFLYRSGAAIFNMGSSVTLSDATLNLGSLGVSSSTVPTNGMYLSAANQIGFATNSNVRWSITSTGSLFGSDAAGPLFANVAASATVPNIIPRRDASTTGIGAQAAGNVSIIAAGAEIARVTSTGLTMIASGANIFAATSGTIGWASGSRMTGGTDGQITFSNAAVSNTIVLNVAAAASVPNLLFPGALFTGGTGTTTFPQMLFQPTGTTAVTTWSTSGTILGMNLVSGFAGNPIDIHVAGAASVFSVNSLGSIVNAGTFFAGNDIRTASTSAFYWNSRSVMRSPADGVLTLLNNAETGFTRLNFGGTTSSFPAIARSGTTLIAQLADGTSGATISTSNLTISGTSVIVSGIGTDAATTSATVCRKTSDSTLAIGSGAAGICLGTSSERYKHDIGNLNAGLNEILKIKPVHYKLNENMGGIDKTLYGFTAEQMNEVLPQLVDKDNQNRPNSVDYMGVVPILVKAIQELKAEINNLKTK